jgi:imidazolonepropionase-like amidohydrolase
MGTLEPGKLADFVVLGQDPTTDLGALRSVTDVVKRGRRHRRADYVHPAPPAANGADA